MTYGRSARTKRNLAGLGLSLVLLGGVAGLAPRLCASDGSVRLPGTSRVITFDRRSPEEFVLATLETVRPRGVSKQISSVGLGGIQAVAGSQLVRLRDSRGAYQSAVLVWGLGGTRDWICLVDVRAPGKLRLLLSEWYEGSFKPHYGRRGELRSLTLNYVAWHTDADLPGHVFLVRDFTWSSGLKRFVPGRFRADTAEESSSTLVQLLYTVGSGPILGVESTWGEKGAPDTFVFEPKGLLRTKVPPEMLWAKKISARAMVITCPKGCRDEIRLLELRTLDSESGPVGDK